METREEHLAWCKQRALEYVELGDYNQALTSMMSDLGKHPGTASHIGIELTVILMFNGLLKTREEVIKHIKGFN